MSDIQANQSDNSQINPSDIKTNRSVIQVIHFYKECMGIFLGLNKLSV